MVSSDNEGSNPSASTKIMITDQLEEAIKGLIYISETDSFWNVVSYNRLNLDCGTIRRMGRHGNTTPCNQLDFDSFFERFYEGNQGSEYRNLYNIMSTNLTNLTVFKIYTNTRVDVYVVGIDNGIRIVGIHAMGTET